MLHLRLPSISCALLVQWEPVVAFHLQEECSSIHTMGWMGNQSFPRIPTAVSWKLVQYLNAALWADTAFLKKKKKKTTEKPNTSTCSCCVSPFPTPVVNRGEDNTNGLIFIHRNQTIPRRGAVMQKSLQLQNQSFCRWFGDGWGSVLMCFGYLWPF